MELRRCDAEIPSILMAAQLPPSLTGTEVWMAMQALSKQNQSGNGLNRHVHPKNMEGEHGAFVCQFCWLREEE